MQTIIGAGGSAGVEVAKALPKYADKIRLVSRNPEKVNETDEVMKADVLDAGKLSEAIKGSDVVYSMVGFPYSYKVWKKNWPVYTRNLIDACLEHDAKLVFFDNIYMYDKDHLNGMDEETPINPPSKKGEVRAEIVDMLMKAKDQQGLKMLIARSADFYSPAGNTSILNETVIKPLSQNKKANLMGPGQYKHSYTYTPDAGKATALLGNTEDAYGEIWHLPTAGDQPTGEEWVKLVAEELGVKPKFQVLTPFMLKMVGLFVPPMREMPEMMYQYNRDYVFNSAKFEKRFDFQPTPYKEGIREVVKLGRFR
ncbi:MAG TPA: NAD-dependent epimerase/dehydratase family protein [Bacteroidales bacterium]|nr:NAD-dependent epimerase/dehydratase family protein [Bacteroidales bacterium]